MPFPDEIKDLLVSKGAGAFGFSLFIGAESIVPIGDGPYTSIVETGGSGSSKTQNDVSTERPTAQIVTRAKNPKDARAQAFAAYTALGGANGLFNFYIDGVFYLSLTSRQNVTEIGLDDAGRAMVAFNIDAEKQPS